MTNFSLDGVSTAYERYKDFVKGQYSCGDLFPRISTYLVTKRFYGLQGRSQKKLMTEAMSMKN